ncbi:MAG: hypothetical protein R3326_04155, partial [Gemmatimonadota bacterium]|nr:hypothetical protein [Gemmatimonadota bacterium]
GRGDFALRSFEGAIHEGPVWDPRRGGREPVLSGASLAPGEFARGWLTFDLPELAHLDELLWQPARNVVYAIWLPPEHPIRRWGEALVFGRVEDADGEPVADAEILVSPVELVPKIPGQEVTIGECTGSSPLSAKETRTDGDGWYRQLLSPTHVEVMCVDVQAVPTPASGLAPARSSGNVRLGSPIPMIEPPEVRIDLSLRAEEDG